MRERGPGARVVEIGGTVPALNLPEQIGLVEGVLAA
jgi:hypothetical protein